MPPKKRGRPPKGRDRDTAYTPKKPIHAPKSEPRLTLKLFNKPQPSNDGEDGARSTTSSGPQDPTRDMAPIFCAEATRIYNDLSSSPLPVMQLPERWVTPTQTDPEVEPKAYLRPWTADELMDLYLLGYTHKHVPTCDLILDTWIHAFQKYDQQAVQDTKTEYVPDPSAPANSQPPPPKLRFWRPNRDHHAVTNHFLQMTQHQHAPVNDNGDPPLAEDVFFFLPRLLWKLYDTTKGDKVNGAREFWVDSMVLCGRRMASTLKYAEPGIWHPTLVSDIAAKALSMVRIRLTLVCEMRWPEEWCKRYHMHRREGKGIWAEGEECYRDAWERIVKPGIEAEKEARKRERRERKEARKRRREGERRVEFEDESVDGEMMDGVEMGGGYGGVTVDMGGRSVDGDGQGIHSDGVEEEITYVAESGTESEEE